MELENIDRGKVVFLRLSDEAYEQLEQLREQAGGRGVATIVKMIVMRALKEGVTVANRESSRKSGKHGRAKAAA